MMKAGNKWVLGLALLLLTWGSAFALGLGQITVKSTLNEPLVAEIPIVSASSAELQGLEVALASSEDFRRAGLNRSRLQVPLEFRIEQRQGTSYIIVTSEEPVGDPVLDILLELNWSTGRLLREYSVLLDPPGLPRAAPTAPEQVASTRAATSAPEAEVSDLTPEPEAAPEPEPEPEPASAPQAPAASAPAPSRDIAPGGEYTVAAGDNVWSVASRATSADNVNRMMLAIRDANPDAFYRDNINALKKGAVLRIPGQDEVAAISAAEARAEVRRQNEIWENPAAAQPSLATAAAPAAPATGAADAADAADAGSRLELVPPGGAGAAGAGRSGVDDGSGDAAVAGLREDLARTSEDLASERQRSDELQARVRDLEGIRDNNQRLLELKDAEIAELQARLAEAGAQSASPEPDAAAPVAAAAEEDEALEDDIFASDADAGAAAADDAEVDADADADADADLAADAVAAADGEETDTDAEAETPGDTAAGLMDADSEADAGTATAPAREEAPASVDEAPAEVVVAAEPEPATDLPWYRQWWVWLLAVLALVLLFLFGRRRGARDEPVLPEGELDLDVDADADLADADGADEDEFALIEALVQHPDNLDLHLELASLYYAQRDEDKFISAAEAMQGHVDDAQQPEWQQVLAMGEELCPNHPLFADLHHEGDAGEVADVGEVSLVDMVDAASDEAAAAEGDGGYSFDFDLTGTGAADEAADDAGLAPEEDGAWTDGPAADDGTQAAPEPEPELAAEPDPEPEPATEFADAAAGESFSSDPVDTKLDLARAYQDMGDSDGARAMLEEVIQEGSEVQKDVARKLLDELG